MFGRKTAQIEALEIEANYLRANIEHFQHERKALCAQVETERKSARKWQANYDKLVTKFETLEREMAKAHGYNQSMERACRELEAQLEDHKRSREIGMAKIRALQYRIDNPGSEPGATPVVRATKKSLRPFSK